VATIVILLATTSRASGEFLEGNALYAKCTSSTPDSRALCVGYVEGVLDAGETEATFALLQEGVRGFKETHRGISMVSTRNSNGGPGGRRCHEGSS
jgi:hypothetical protein